MRSTIHEMRNQLAVAVANIEAFIDGKLVPTSDRLRSVLQALNELDVLIGELRPPAEPQLHPTNRRWVDVCALMLNETTAIEATAQAAGITLDIDSCASKGVECANFLCDPGQVSQVVKNVLLNAIKYTGRGGRVKLYCHREPGVLALEISDSGPGVPVGERLTIFESGVRGSASNGATGSGVGLAVVRSIIDAHGGTVAVDDDQTTGGARFKIYFPGDTNPAATCTDGLGRSPLLHENITPVG